MDIILALMLALLTILGIAPNQLDTLEPPTIGTALYCEELADGSTACWESAP